MALRTDILLATNNAHKVHEISAVLGAGGMGVLSLAEAGVDAPAPAEDAQTFIDNALIKARYYAKISGLLCLADDSGLMVDALGGEPGVRSARFAGVEGGRSVIDPANNAKLLEALADVPDDKRTARYVCVMVLVDGEQVLAQVQGEVSGRILRVPRGDNGFGYDPLMYLPEVGKTAAELSPAAKNAISHRGRAARAMLEKIATL